MSDINQGSGTGIMVAAIIGAAVGAGAALLLAPCSGKETRGWLADRSRQLKDRTTSAFEHAQEAVRQSAKEIGRNAADGEIAHDRPVYPIGDGTKSRG